MKRASIVQRFSTVILLLGSLISGSVSAAAILTQISPNPTTYVEGVDYKLFSDTGTQNGSVLADVTAPLYFFGTWNGCSAVDGGPWLQGGIAMIGRGTCLFSTKVNVAASLGAVGVLIYDNVNEPLSSIIPTLAELTEIPSLFITYDLARTLYLDMVDNNGPVMIRMNNVSEPESLGLLLMALGVMGYTARRRRLN